MVISKTAGAEIHWPVFRAREGIGPSLIREHQLREKRMNEPPYQWQIELRPDDDEMAGVIEDFTGTRSEAERKANELTDRCPFFPRALVFHRCGPALNHERGAPAP